MRDLATVIYHSIEASFSTGDSSPTESATHLVGYLSSTIPTVLDDGARKSKVPTALLGVGVLRVLVDGESPRLCFDNWNRS